MLALFANGPNLNWELKEIPVPKPKAGQVLLKIQASGLCYTDIHATDGMMGLKYPFSLGHEPIGEIVELGSGVTHLKVGDRVGVFWHQSGCMRCPNCQSERKIYCTGQKYGDGTWMEIGGSHAEYMLAYASGCVLLPKNIPAVELAPLMCAGYTIASGYQNANPKTLETIAVLGVGGLGHLAIQYAKAKGHPVIAITSKEDKKQLCIDLGASEVICKTGGIGQALLALGGADVILDCSNNNQTAEDAIFGLKPEGRFVVMGIEKKPLKIDTLDLLHSQKKIIGSTQNYQKDLIDILALAANGKIKPMIEVFPLKEHQKAVEKLKSDTIRFRAVFDLEA